MKILQVYNQQRSLFGGEESVVNTIRQILERNGHVTSVEMKSSRDAAGSLAGKVNMAVQGVFNLAAYREMKRLLSESRPDVVHAHNVYPNYSPSIFAACRAVRVPALFHVHCHVLTCPNWYHLRNGKTCDRCFGGREYNCLLTNCRGSLPESAAYTVRSYVARRLGLFRKNPTLIVTVSEFLRDRLVAAGYPADQIEVVRNAVTAEGSNSTSAGVRGSYIGYAGRLSFEKGVDVLLEAARACGLPVKVAGDGPEYVRLRASAPSNVEFVGRLDREQLGAFYRHSRFIVAPSRNYEGFHLVAAEAMMHGKPVIASRIGALPELIESGKRGLLVTTDDHTEFANSMRLLWHDDALCRRLGEAAKAWVEEHCNEQRFYARLMQVYNRAISMTRVPLKSAA